MGHIFAFMTADAVSIDGTEDEREERHGWIDKEWSMTVLHESRNDVSPLVSVEESDAETLADEIRDVLGDGSLYFDNGDGSFYAHDSTEEDGFSWTYAVHFKRKFLGSNGWIETDWHPETDGGISLSE